MGGISLIKHATNAEGSVWKWKSHLHYFEASLSSNSLVSQSAARPGEAVKLQSSISNSYSRSNVRSEETLQES